MRTSALCWSIATCAGEERGSARRALVIRISYDLPVAANAGVLSGEPDLPPLRRNRDFQLLWIGQALSSFGSRVSGISVPLLVLEGSGSAADVGLVSFIGLLPILLFTLPAGALLDRSNRRLIMLTCQIGRGVAVTSLAVCVALGHIWLAQVAAVLFIDITGLVFFSVGERAALPRVVPAEHRRAAVSQNMARDYGALLLGRPVGGFLFSVGRAVPFVVDAASYLCSVVTLLLIRTTFEGARKTQRYRLRIEIAEGLRWLWHQPFLRTISLIVAASDLTVNAVNVVVIVLAHKHGASSTMIGVMIALSGLGGILGAAIAPRLSAHLTIRSAIALTLGAMVALLPLLLIVHAPLTLGVIYGAMFLAYPTWSAIHWAYFAALVPDHLQGRVQSIATLLSLGPVPFGVLVVGLMLQFAGAGVAVGMLAAIVAATLVFALLSRSVRDAPPLNSQQPATSAASGG